MQYFSGNGGRSCNGNRLCTYRCDLYGNTLCGKPCILLPSDRKKDGEKQLIITIPESLDYSGVFSDLFDKYTSGFELIHVKTTNMGSLFKLTYSITLKNGASEKAFIDDLRCRNGNLEISLGRPVSQPYEQL